MGLIWGVLGAIVIAVVARLISEDVKDWLSWIPRHLIRRAVSHLPEAERERLEEEWSSHVNDMPGVFAKIYVAYGYLAAARSISKFVMSGSSPNFAETFQKATLRTFGSLGAAALLVFFMPLMVFVALCIKVESRGPVFSRIAVKIDDGSALQLILFRSMYVDRAHSTVFGDVTRVGAFIRKAHLDVIPLLFNVLTGDVPLAQHPFVYFIRLDFYDLLEKLSNKMTRNLRLLRRLWVALRKRFD